MIEKFDVILRLSTKDGILVEGNREEFVKFCKGLMSDLSKKENVDALRKELAEIPPYCDYSYFEIIVARLRGQNDLADGIWHVLYTIGGIFYENKLQNVLLTTQVIIKNDSLFNELKDLLFLLWHALEPGGASTWMKKYPEYGKIEARVSELLGPAHQF